MGFFTVWQKTMVQRTYAFGITQIDLGTKLINLGYRACMGLSVPLKGILQKAGERIEFIL